MKPKRMTAEKPILFSAPMVKAILEDRKSQTRRVVKVRLDASEKKAGLIMCEDPNQFRRDYPVKGFPRLHVPFRHHEETEFCSWDDGAALTFHSPYTVGMRLWVKETFMPDPYCSANFIYRAAEKELDRYVGHHWKPSIFMPRKASRITLEVTEVRVERLQDISEDDAKAEGVREPGDWMDYDHRKKYDAIMKVHGTSHYQTGFRLLWQSINGVGSWEKNSWVWAISFKRIQ